MGATKLESIQINEFRIAIFIIFLCALFIIAFDHGILDIYKIVLSMVASLCFVLSMSYLKKQELKNGRRKT